MVEWGKSNFDGYPMLRINEMPVVESYIANSRLKVRGVVEPAVTPIALAIANTVFAANGYKGKKTNNIAD